MITIKYGIIEDVIGKDLLIFQTFPYPIRHLDLSIFAMPNDVRVWSMLEDARYIELVNFAGDAGVRKGDCLQQLGMAVVGSFDEPFLVLFPTIVLARTLSANKV